TRTRSAPSSSRSAISPEVPASNSTATSITRLSTLVRSSWAVSARVIRSRNSRWRRRWSVDVSNISLTLRKRHSNTRAVYFTTVRRDRRSCQENEIKAYNREEPKMANITRWDPFQEMLTLREAMNQLFEDSVVRPGNARGQGFVPALDLSETKDGFVVEAALP